MNTFGNLIKIVGTKITYTVSNFNFYITDTILWCSILHILFTILRYYFYIFNFYYTRVHQSIMLPSPDPVCVRCIGGLFLFLPTLILYNVITNHIVPRLKT